MGVHLLQSKHTTTMKLQIVFTAGLAAFAAAAPAGDAQAELAAAGTDIFNLAKGMMGQFVKRADLVAKKNAGLKNGISAEIKGAIAKASSIDDATKNKGFNLLNKYINKFGLGEYVGDIKTKGESLRSQAEGYQGDAMAAKKKWEAKRLSTAYNTAIRKLTNQAKAIGDEQTRSELIGLIDAVSKEGKTQLQNRKIWHQKVNNMSKIAQKAAAKALQDELNDYGITKDSVIKSMQTGKKTFMKNTTPKKLIAAKKQVQADAAEFMN